MDLLEKLAGIDVHGMQRFWRRLYDDAGYWLKSEISASETLSCMALAGAVSDNLLGYAYASGFMKNSVELKDTYEEHQRRRIVRFRP